MLTLSLQSVLLIFVGAMAGRRSRKKSSVFSTHPLFMYRRAALVADVIGLLLGIGLFNDYYRFGTEVWAFACGLFFVSILLVQWDFYDWKDHMKNKTNLNRSGGGRRLHYGTCAAGGRSVRVQTGERAPLLDRHHVDDDDNDGVDGGGGGGDDNNDRVHRSDSGRNRSSNDDGDDDGGGDGGSEWRWPRRVVMVIDIIIAVLSFLTYGSELGMISTYSYGYNSNVIGQAYVSVCTLACSLIHARCWWIEFVARMKSRWEDERQENHQDEAVPGDLEAARSQCVCDGGRVRDGDAGGPSEIRNGHTEESRILNRVLRFLGRNSGDATLEETHAEEQQRTDIPHIAADSTALTPESSSSGRPYEEQDNEQSTGSKSGLGVESSQTLDTASQDAVLVIKKNNKSKKGKEKETKD